MKRLSQTFVLACDCRKGLTDGTREIMGNILEKRIHDVSNFFLVFMGVGDNGKEIAQVTADKSPQKENRVQRISIRTGAHLTVNPT